MRLGFAVITLMPEMFKAMHYGVCRRAIENDLIRLDLLNPRDWSKRAYRAVDDRPFGGGPGMVMTYEPMKAAIQSAKMNMPDSAKVVYLSPQGQQQDQTRLHSLAERRQSIVFIAGRYEGIDERIIHRYVDEEWSLGDLVLSGGELAAMAYMDAIIRLLPGVLGHAESAEQDSFTDGLLDCPHYTRPAQVDGMEVPSVLLGGNHRSIQRWRRKMALGNTWQKRPDLLSKIQLSDEDQRLLQEFIEEQ